MSMIETDYLVIGSGIAGLYVRAARRRARPRRRRHQARRRRVEHQLRAGRHRRGARSDRLFEAHIDDTLTVGDGLCHRDVVELCVRDGPARGARADRPLGARFDAQRRRRARPRARRRPLRAPRRPRQGHHRPRDRARAASPRSRAHPEHHACSPTTWRSTSCSSPSTAAPTPASAPTSSTRRRARCTTVVARATVLATGGAGKVYLYTTNPDVATGDGVAMAYRAGARDREHGVHPVPPDLPVPPARQELPHLRGAARRGRHPASCATGETFMERYHPMKSLAPRDVVARAIDNELKRTGDDCVVLDMTHLDPDVPRRALPDHPRRAACSFGIDMRDAADPGRPRRALLVRRRRHRLTRAHQPCATCTPSARSR